MFRSLADTESGVKYWSESTLCRFLELPDALGVGSVIFQMSSYLGAFPLPSQAPAILTYDALLKVVTIMTERFGVVLKKRSRELWLRELYRSLAIYDRGIQKDIEDSKEKRKSGQSDKEKTTGSGGGFAIDMPEGGDEEEEEEEEGEDDELVLAALDSMDATDVFKQGEQSNVHHSIIPTDNLLKLVELLLLIAPIDPQQSISSLAPDMTEDRVEELRQAANAILSSFGVENHPGVSYRTYDTVVSACLPYLFNGLHPLFEHFLFARDMDLSKRKDGSTSPTQEKQPVIPPPKIVAQQEPLLRETGDVLNLTILSQLSFFIKSTQIFRALRPLYNGDKHGFSMGSFEKQVFNWRAPTILLVKGRLLPLKASSTRERALEEILPPRRYQSSIANDASSQQLIYGAYIPNQWKHTGKTCFGDSQTELFQLSPVHDVFSASQMVKDYVYFSKSPTSPAGVGLGTPIPTQSSAHSRSTSIFRAGPVSLHLDDALEFGIFTHLAEGGGSFHSSRLPCRKGKSWQDRFEIEALEVWGCGGDEVAEAQRREWAWNEREAEARRRINVGTGDIEADRQLLEMAGLIGGNRSGGSI